MQPNRQQNKQTDNNQDTKSSLIVVNSNANIKTQQNRKQLSSFILFLSVIIFVNLCPFHPELELFNNNDDNNNNNYHHLNDSKHAALTTTQIIQNTNLNSCFEFIKLMFTNPINFNKRKGIRRGSIQAEARVIGKMAKMWYIKKKIKKLSKKLKKHTIAVPVFTAIPIYEHSYYPQPHVTHVSHGGAIHHAAAASSYSPALAQIATTTSGQTVVGPVPATASQQLATSASTNHQQLAHPYRPMMAGGHHHHHSVYHPMQTASGHQIINSYAPSPPLYVDDAGGLYGTYNNAYGRYDGGYHLW